MGPRGRSLLAGCALALLTAAPARADVHVVEGAHYRLRFEGTQAEAAQALRVLEAAWEPLRAWFGAAPALAAQERLEVCFYATHDDWVRGIHADGTQAPAGAGGYYWPPTRRAHLYRQPTEYFTRTLLVHEAVHQFHYLARTRNQAPSAGWYTEGIAEYLSWHRWDGERLELAVLPGVSLKDYAAAALAELEAPDFDLAACVDGRRPASRAVAWALVRYLARGVDDGPVPHFDAFRRKMDAGGQAWPLFKSLVGRPGKVQPRLLAWLRGHQAPWAQVFNEWEQVGERAFRGHAGVVSACRLKGTAASLEARLALPARGQRWRAGLLLHWTSNDDYTVAMLDRRGRVTVDRRVGGRWDRLFAGGLPPPEGVRARRLRAVREGERVAFEVDGLRLGVWSLPGTTLGLAVDNGDVRFEEVRSS